MGRVLCVVVAVLAAAVSAAPARAEATATTTVQTTSAPQISPGTKALIEACLGEAVQIVGDSLLVVHRTTLADGSRLVLVHRNPLGGFAVGASSGTTYRIGASDTLVRFLAPSGTFVATFAADLHVVAPSGGAGFFGHIFLHATVTPEGDVTAEIEVVDSHCV